MTEFQFEDPDLKSSMLEIGFPSCAMEKDSFTDSQGKQIRTENKKSFQAEFQKQRAHCVVAVAVLVAKGPYWLVEKQRRSMQKPIQLLSGIVLLNKGRFLREEFSPK